MAKRFSHTVDREPIEFEMGGEDFAAPALLAPETLGDLLDRQDVVTKIDPATERGALDQITQVLAEMFDLILEPESATRVRARLLSRDRPFDLHREVMPTITSLVEAYTGRPTPPSSPSQTGLNGGGTSSTAGAQPTTLTLSPLAPAVS